MKGPSVANINFHLLFQTFEKMIKYLKNHIKIKKTILTFIIPFNNNYNKVYYDDFTNYK